MDLYVGIAILLAVVALAVWSRMRGGSGEPGAPASSSPALAAPSSVSRWEMVARNAAARYGLPWQIILAQIWKESWGDPNDPGADGEIGLMQLKEHEAIADIRKFGYGDFSDWKTNPATNVMAGAAYLDLNMRPGRANNDLYLALRMYNQGPTGAFTYAGKSRSYADDVMKKAKQIGY